jgi:hypothetical protein
MVVFHCYYSQSRAPIAAKWVIERLGGKVVSVDPHGSSSTVSGSDVTSNHSSVSDELPIDVRVLQGGWWQWNEKYHGHPQLYESIHPMPTSTTTPSSSSSKNASYTDKH